MTSVTDAFGEHELDAIAEQRRREVGQEAPAADVNAAAEALLPTPDDKEYAREIDAKHFAESGFDPESLTQATAGSVFVPGGPAGVEELIALAAAQRRAGIAGDDRDELRARGVDPRALSDECRYLIVETPGLVGMRAFGDLADDAPILAVRTKEGLPRSLVVPMWELEPTEFATIIVGPGEGPNGTQDVLWTAHPGLPVAPAVDDPWGLDGDQPIATTAGAVRRALESAGLTPPSAVQAYAPAHFVVDYTRALAGQSDELAREATVDALLADAARAMPAIVDHYATSDPKLNVPTAILGEIGRQYELDPTAVNERPNFEAAATVIVDKLDELGQRDVADMVRFAAGINPGGFASAMQHLPLESLGKHAERTFDAGPRARDRGI